LNKTAKIIAAFAKGWLSYFLKGRPLWAILYVTRKCNLSCRYCMFKNDESVDPYLDDIFIYLDKIKETGCNIVSITGGEPTLRKDLPKIIAHCKEKNLISYLNTNGHLLTASLINELGKAGLDIVNISLDSVSPNLNSNKDIHRTRKKIDLLIEGKEKYGYAIISNQVITKDNLHEIHPLIEQLRAKRIYVAHGIKYPIADEFKSPADLRRLTEALSQLNQKKSNGYPIITSEKYIESSIKWANRPSSWNCLAGAAFFTVDLDGSVLGCDRLPTTSIHISDLTIKNFTRVLSDTRKMNEFSECSFTCMINCAFETSFICSSPYMVFKVLFQTVRMVAWPTLQKTAKQDNGISKRIA
jgi:MoaA/NifB/PqqE/SkfB family radical SAM enzyme